MSSVVPTSDSALLTQYRKAVSELENELDSVKKKDSDSANKQINRINESHSRELVHREKNQNATINNILNESSSHLERQKEDSKQSEDKLKQQLYTAIPHP